MNFNLEIGMFKKIIIQIVMCIPLMGFSSGKQILDTYLSPKDKRYQTFLTALKLIEKRDCQMLVETGTARNGDKNLKGDGGSTILFGTFIKERGGTLYSIDINQKAIDQAKNACENKEIQEGIFFCCNDSISLLKDFGQPIDFLYLDSYDYDVHHPELSQKHHLREIEAAYPWLSEKCVVLIDDHALPYGGKGKLVIPFLRKRGWRVFQSEYQVVLIRK